MTDKQDIKLLHSPDKLLVGFTRSRFISCLLLAAAAHLVVFMLFSLSYMRDQMDPEGAERRQAEALAIQRPKPSPDSSSTVLQDTAVSTIPDVVTDTTSSAIQAHAVEDSRTNTVIMREITDLPKPGETPAAPDDLGISISDTNLE